MIHLKIGYHLRSLAETAMSRMKMQFGERSSLRDYDAQVREAMARVKALNKMTLLGIPFSERIAL